MSYRVQARPGNWGWRLFLCLFAVYCAGGLYFGYLFFNQVQVLVQGPELPDFNTAQAATDPRLAVILPPPPPPAIVAAPDGSPHPAEPGTRAQPDPAAAVATATPQDPSQTWQFNKRVNILLMGLDQREDTAEWDPGRTDTMILATIDPYGKTAALLSIPRDLLVAIPTKTYGTLQEKITGAHTYGALEGYPDGQNPLGGPALAAKTVELNFGVPVHYWARIDLRGFEEGVDRLGGVWIDVEQPIVDNEYPTDDYGTMAIYIPAGRQLMDGHMALQYARSRHSGNDLERGQRQRQVLLAMRQQALQLDVIRRLPEFVDLFNEHFVTNMTVEQMVALANIARTIPSANVRSRAIDARYVTGYNSTRTGDALVPQREAIAELIRELFYTDTRLLSDGVRIGIRNGAGREGLAGAWAKYLKNLYFDVARFDTADRNDYAETVIIDRTPNGIDRTNRTARGAYTLSYLRHLLGNLPDSRIRHVPQPDADVDIEIILGADAPNR